MILRVHGVEDLEHGEPVEVLGHRAAGVDRMRRRKTMTGLLRDLAATFSAALGRVGPG